MNENDFNFKGGDIISRKLGDEIREEGISHKEWSIIKENDGRIILTLNKNEDYLENPKVKELISKGYFVKNKFVLSGSCQLVMEKQD